MRNLCTLALLLGSMLSASGAVTNLYDAVTGAGKSLSLVGTTGIYCDNQALLFNGVTYAELIDGTKDPNERILVSKGVTPSVKVTVPADFEPGSRIVLRRVDLYPVTYWGNAKLRMPTEYQVFGTDDAGREYELAHPTGVTYPNLRSNGSPGECYGVDIVETNPVQIGFRTYRIVLLDSAGNQNGNPYPFSLMEIELKVEVLPADPVFAELYGQQNFSQLIRSAGYSVWSTANPLCVLQQNCWSVAGNAFDGTTFGSNRWMGYLGKDGGVYGEIRMPADFRAGDGFFLWGVRLWSLSEQSREIARAPTEWKIFGTETPQDTTIWGASTEDAGWTLLDHQSGKDWSGVAYATQGTNTLGYISASESSATGYRGFRFRPIASTCTDNVINVGLNEVELFGVLANGKGTLRVRSSQAGCDFGAGCPADGALISAATTVTAPEVVSSAEAVYRVKGYRVETFDYANLEWPRGELVESRTYAYVPDADKSVRLVWELEDAGYKIDTRLLDGGNEAPVTYDPAPEGEPYYTLGTVLTLTAHPNTDVLEEAAGATNKFRSAFVRWEGDTNGLADVTSPTITFTVDGSRELHPVYRRDWLVYAYNKANEGGSGTEWRLTDGNFDLKCLKAGGFDGNVLTYQGTGWLVKGFGPLDLSTKFVRSTTGQEITITSIGWQQLGGDSARRADFTRVTLPRTLTSCVCSSFRDQTNLVEVVVDCPNLTEMGNAVFTRDTYIDRVVFKAPKLERITGSYLFFRARMLKTDASDWDLSSLKTLSTGGDSRFSIAELGSGYGFYGTLSLPALETIGDYDFSTQQHVTNAVLGTARGTLSHVGGYAFNSAVGLESLTIGCTENLFVSNNAFYGCAKLKNVTFVKYIPPQAAMDAILANATASSRAKVYVSAARRQWPGFLTAIDPDLDPNPPEDAVGVYVTAGGERKAWIFYRASPLDPKGTVLIFR